VAGLGGRWLQDADLPEGRLGPIDRVGDFLGERRFGGGPPDWPEVRSAQLRLHVNMDLRDPVNRHRAYNIALR